MRASEVLGLPVVDAAGREIGILRDLRARHVVEGSRGSARGRFRIVGLVVGGMGIIDAAAHGWGFVEGRAQGPWVLRRLAARAADASVFVPSEEVESWGPAVVRLRCERSKLLPLKEALGR